MDCTRCWIGVDGDFEMSKEKFERTKRNVDVIVDVINGVRR